jgi:hypothetical protein
MTDTIIAIAVSVICAIGIPLCIAGALSGMGYAEFFSALWRGMKQ